MLRLLRMILEEDSDINRPVMSRKTEVDLGKSSVQYSAII